MKEFQKALAVFLAGLDALENEKQGQKARHPFGLAINSCRNECQNIGYFDPPNLPHASARLLGLLRPRQFGPELLEWSTPLPVPASALKLGHVGILVQFLRG